MPARNLSPGEVGVIIKEGKHGTVGEHLLATNVCSPSSELRQAGWLNIERETTYLGVDPAIRLVRVPSKASIVLTFDGADEIEAEQEDDD